MHFVKLPSYIFFVFYTIVVNNLFADDANQVDTPTLENPQIQNTTENTVVDTNNNAAAKTDEAQNSIKNDTQDDSQKNANFDLGFDNIIDKDLNSRGNNEKKEQQLEPNENENSKNLSIDSSNLNVILLLDTSGSMNMTDPTRLRDEGVRLFLQFLKEGDKISIVKFSDTTKVLMKQAYFNKDGLGTLLKGLSLIENTGLYTDLYNAINKALELIKESDNSTEAKNEKYKNVIILFSDGKMEPNENIISKEDALKNLQEKVMPELNANDIKLYTLSFSDEADKDFLKGLADSTGALSWYTPSADTIHESFSKLFLAVQKPQILPISEKGLRIDGQVDEATFYLNVRDDKDIVIISPSGKKIIKVRHDDNIKWFSGSKFEIITVSKPEPGLWNFVGSISKDDFAIVLTRLKLATFWPYSVDVNEDTLLQARVFDGKKPLMLPEISKLATVAYKITPTDRVSAPTGGGVLNDDGTGADKVALDGIFSANVKIETPGEYELWIVIKTPTFERHQKIPFVVKSRLISLEDPIAQSDKTTVFKVKLNEDALALKVINVNLIAEKLNKKFDIPLIRDKDNDNILVSSSRYLKEDGEYTIYATLSGIDQRGENVSYESQSLNFMNIKETVPEKVETLAQVKDEEKVEPKQEELPEGESFIIEHLAVLLFNLVLLVMVLLYFKKNSSKKNSFDISDYKVSDDILNKIKSLEEKSKVQEVDTSSFVFMDDEDDNDSSNETDKEKQDEINYENVTSISDVNVEGETESASKNLFDNQDNNGNSEVTENVKNNEVKNANNNDNQSQEASDNKQEDGNKGG
ncbi:MAG: VWA domain-containing protein [Bdellovibrionota bacterium]|nr:VWA domain-containing protein [Bdellovibrionota bacterium]